MITIFKFYIILINTSVFEYIYNIKSHKEDIDLNNKMFNY